MNEIFKKNCFWFLSFTCDVKFFLKLGTSQTEVTNLKINFFVIFLYFLYGGWQFLYLFFKFFLIFAFSFFHCTIHSVKSCDRNYPKKKSLSFLNLPQKWRRTDDKLKIRDGVKSPDVLTRVLCRHFHKIDENFATFALSPCWIGKWEPDFDKQKKCSEIVSFPMQACLKESISIPK